MENDYASGKSLDKLLDSVGVSKEQLEITDKIIGAEEFLETDFYFEFEGHPVKLKGININATLPASDPISLAYNETDFDKCGENIRNFLKKYDLNKYSNKISAELSLFQIYTQEEFKGRLYGGDIRVDLGCQLSIKS